MKRGKSAFSRRELMQGTLYAMAASGIKGLRAEDFLHIPEIEHPLSH